MAKEFAFELVGRRDPEHKPWGMMICPFHPDETSLASVGAASPGRSRAQADPSSDGACPQTA